MTDPQICTVSGITARIKARLDEMPLVTVEGEVSNFRPPNASGHLYFSLVDEKAKLNAAFFAYRQALQKQLPTFQNGDKIRATGTISVYAPHGSYHLNVERIERCDGVGELLQRFELLKRKLYAEGVCDADKKKPLPLLPKRIGIVTAPTGAAIRDILNILSRRFPNLHIIVAPCRVQGPEAAEEIATAIELLNRFFAPGQSDEPMDAMIVGRGGGSFEELWCFNEERVARAVIASQIPVISAVGHEPDIAITDFVADLRAPTPSAAAELICGRKEDFEQRLADLKDRLLKALRVSFMDARNRIRRCETSALFRDPIHLLDFYAQQTDNRENRLQAGWDRLLAGARQRLGDAQLRLEQAGGHLFERAHRTLDDATVRLETALTHAVTHANAHLVSQTATLKAMDPKAVLKRGYALVSDASGTIVTDATTSTPGDVLNIRFATTALTATVIAPVADTIQPDD